MESVRDRQTGSAFRTGQGPLVGPGARGGFAGGRGPATYDEVLATRLAGGLQRLAWLGATLERLTRRRPLAPEPQGPLAPGGAPAQLGRSTLGASAVKIQEL